MSHISGVVSTNFTEESLGFERWNGKNALLKIVVLELHGDMCWSQCALECVEGCPRIAVDPARSAVKLNGSVES